MEEVEGEGGEGGGKNTCLVFRHVQFVVPTYKPFPSPPTSSSLHLTLAAAWKATCTYIRPYSATQPISIACIVVLLSRSRC